jgi:hypothetical protein
MRIPTLPGVSRVGIEFRILALPRKCTLQRRIVVIERGIGDSKSIEFEQMPTTCRSNNREKVVVVFTHPSAVPKEFEIHFVKITQRVEYK